MATFRSFPLAHSPPQQTSNLMAQHRNDNKQARFEKLNDTRAKTDSVVVWLSGSEGGSLSSTSSVRSTRPDPAIMKTLRFTEQYSIQIFLQGQPENIHERIWARAAPEASILDDTEVTQRILVVKLQIWSLTVIR